MPFVVRFAGDTTPMAAVSGSIETAHVPGRANASGEARGTIAVTTPTGTSTCTQVPWQVQAPSS
ncbi:MAG: hypothetical protein R2712_05950 [Vicinamibacterales bacterium]